ncbi:MAG: Lrp/AsnC family transcriptional regulator [Desulfobacteraceae bacterium]|jgi:Lrp/AsnC family leucine-responsive transcriptional regulator|nr:Lrp/AsnC family transcriptional regulator [Desulfobacteraceae bacterium]
MIDEISFKILKILQKKARIPNVEVARQVGMAPSAVLERIRKLEKQGIIEGYEVRLNPRHFNRSLVAFVSVALGQPSAAAGVGRKLAEIPLVQEVHFVAGEDGFFLKIRAADTEELEYVLREQISGIKAVTATRTWVVLSTHKETARIPIE